MNYNNMTNNLRNLKREMNKEVKEDYEETLLGDVKQQQLSITAGSMKEPPFKSKKKINLTKYSKEELSTMAKISTLEQSLEQLMEDYHHCLGKQKEWQGKAFKLAEELQKFKESQD